MDKKYFLYIDILGFSDLVSKNNKEIDAVYKIIDSLNAHKHDAFKTIVFSDTILVYSKVPIAQPEEHDYVVMYACEFVKDLMYHLAHKNITFRAILTYDDFKHYELDNVECYYGSALVNCYNKESEINGMGLFIDKRINKHNKIFRTTNYDSDLSFVSVFQCLDSLSRNSGGILPIDDTITIEQTDEYWGIKFELNILRHIYKGSLAHENNKVRSKFLQTYQLYKNLYKPLLLEFEKTGFDVNTINPNANWSAIRETY